MNENRVEQSNDGEGNEERPCNPKQPSVPIEPGVILGVLARSLPSFSIAEESGVKSAEKWDRAVDESAEELRRHRFLNELT